MNVTRNARNNSAIGTLLITGFDGTEMTSRISSLLTRLQPAGVILFARNIKDAEQTWKLLHDSRKCVSNPLFTCVDLEGGRVDRFRDVLGPTPSAAEVFATGSRKAYRRHGEIVGENCRAMGFNVDFAPALDLALEASRSVMSSRAVSANPREVAGYGKEFLTGLRAARVLGCGKHFPGLGEGTLDSHHELPVIDKSMKKLWAEDLFPYRSLHRQLPMVMISHAAYPQVTGDRSPASLSETWVTKVLRRRIGYRGLIVSDDLEMGGVLSAAPIGEAAVGFVRAGGDVCLICHREDHVEQAYERLLKATQQDPKFARRLAESVRRVTAFKKKFGTIFAASRAPSPSSVDRLAGKLREFEERVRGEGLKRAEDSPS
jgi:beta-N-acetylhexosaminidase